jgi:hypothetical protein
VLRLARIEIARVLLRIGQTICSLAEAMLPEDAKRRT